MRKYGGLAQMGQGVVIWTLLGRNLSLAGAGDIALSAGGVQGRWRSSGEGRNFWDELNGRK